MHRSNEQTRTRFTSRAPAVIFGSLDPHFSPFLPPPSPLVWAGHFGTWFLLLPGVSFQWCRRAKKRKILLGIMGSPTILMNESVAHVHHHLEGLLWAFFQLLQVEFTMEV